jgi:protocatechuate 3,4-dioxygenase beta subunit
VTAGISRRQALTALGGAAVLGACGASKRPAATAASPAAATASATAPATAAPGTTAAATPAPTASGAAVAGLTAVTAASFAAAGACAVTPEQTEGPYYIDVDKIRADIREDRAGTRLRVGVRVLDADGCTPLKDAVFEIWHCDAGGLYSGFEQSSRGGPGGGVSDTKRYLRGAQVTDADGIAVVTTIYPGWYRGRTVHVHAKVALSNASLLTTQLYFDEAVTAEVYKAAPYDARTGRDTFNTDDGIYRAETTLTVTADGDGRLGLITIGVRG